VYNAFVFSPFDSEKQICFRSVWMVEDTTLPRILSYCSALPQALWLVDLQLHSNEKNVSSKIKSYFIQQCLLYSLKVITWMHCNEWFGCIKHYTSVVVLYLSTEIGPQNGPETILLPFYFNFTIKLVVIICFDIIVFY